MSKDVRVPPEAGDHPAGCEIRQPFDDLVHQDDRWFAPSRRILGRHGARKLLEAIIDQCGHLVWFFKHQEALKGTYADVTVAQPHHHRRTRRRRLVITMECFASLDDRKGLRCVDAQRLEHFGGEHFPDGAYQDIPGLCKVATLDQIETQGWSLNPGRYVGVAEREEDDFDFAERLQELKADLDTLNAEAHALEKLIGQKLALLLNGR